MRRSFAFALASMLLWSSRGSAQEYAPPPPPPGAVPVYVRNEDPTIRHRLSTRDGMTVAVCTGNCTMYVAPGLYVFESSETEELRAGKKKLTIGGPTVIDVSPGSKSTRQTGLILGVTGSAGFLVGLIGVYVIAITSVVCEIDNHCERPSYTPWVITMLGGAGVATAGWVMFGSAGTGVRAETYAASPRVSFGAAPLPNGGAFGLSVRF